MTTTVRFTDGQLLDINVFDPVQDENIFCLSSSAKHLRHCAVLCIDNELVVYRILRKSRDAGPIRKLLNEAEENLFLYYGFTFKGLIWGHPAITRISGRWWWLLNDIPVINELGQLSLPFQDILGKYQIENPDTEKLLAFFESVRNSSVFTIPN